MSEHKATASKPSVTAKKRNWGKRVVFTYNGPYAIGVSWTIVKNGVTIHKEETLHPGDTAVFTAKDGTQSVTCIWGFGAPVTKTLSQRHLAQAS